MKRIYIAGKQNNGKYVIVDDEDHEYLNQFKWYLNHKGYAYMRRYMRRKEQTIMMARVIADTPKGKLTDHINHDKRDNRKVNLRICNDSENSANRKPLSMSGYKGVYWCARNKKWRVLIHKEKKQYELGYFCNPIDAAKAYDNKAKEIFGEFAYLNIGRKLTK